MASKIVEPKKTPVGGFGERFKNMLKNNFRGIVGVLVPLCILAPQLERFNNIIKLKCMWLTMLWFYLVQPVCVPVTALMPVFALPFGGIMNSILTCKSYMNDTIMLFILSGWLIVLLNNSGLDKRIAFWFICSGDASQYNARSMVFKCGTAAFILSIFSNRLIVTYTLTQIITNSYDKMAESSNAKEENKREKEEGPDYITMSDIVNNAIQTSAGIGGTAIMHSSIVNILFRGCFQALAKPTYEYPDIFNYLQYSAFAFPVAIVMFFCNILYHMHLVSGGGSLTMSAAQTAEFKKIIAKENALVPPQMSLHEMLTGISALLYLISVLFRWSYLLPGWALYTRDEKEKMIPGCKDATVAAIFVIMLHIIPKGYGFLKIFGAKKKNDLPPHKPESAILWYRYIDKNINYGYLFVYGSAFAIIQASTLAHLDHELSANSGKIITGQTWNVGLLMVVVVASILTNVITPMAACSMWLPYVLLISVDGADPWPASVYQAALGVGIACNFGFCLPYQYTPAYYCHHTGKLRTSKIIKYSIPSVIICTIILYLFLIWYAPFLWDPKGEGFVAVLPATNAKKTTTTAPPDIDVPPGDAPGLL